MNVYHGAGSVKLPSVARTTLVGFRRVCMELTTIKGGTAYPEKYPQKRIYSDMNLRIV